MSKESEALAVREPSNDGLVLVCAPTEAEQRMRDLQDFVRRVMVDGEDYGVLPGTKVKEGEKPKKVLYQPGAQKLAEIYGLAIRYEDERPPIEKWDEDNAFFAYFKRAVITRRTDGMFLGSGVGSCNSREEKYAARWAFERDVPSHIDKSRLRTKSGVGKNNKPYTMYRVPNPAIFDLVNTIEKMACKRALVHAVIAVTRSAGIFTQDLEDMSPEARGVREEIQDAEFMDEPHVHREERQAQPSRTAQPAKATAHPPVDPAIQALADEKERLAAVALAKVAYLDGVDALLATVMDASPSEDDAKAYQRAGARRIIELATTQEHLRAASALAKASGAPPEWHERTKALFLAKKAQIVTNGAAAQPAQAN